MPIAPRLRSSTLPPPSRVVPPLVSKRQWRQRLAGLRTNTLMAFGAAGLTVFAASLPGEVSARRFAAQVISGIGFLGAGIIFREGFNVRGLNTAATM